MFQPPVLLEINEKEKFDESNNDMQAVVYWIKV